MDFFLFLKTFLPILKKFFKKMHIKRTVLEQKTKILHLNIFPSLSKVDKNIILQFLIYHYKIIKHLIYYTPNNGRRSY